MNDLIGSTIKFEWVKTPEQQEEMKAFAESFPTQDHKVASFKWPYCFSKRANRKFGYHQIYSGPLVFPSFHTDPNVCRPRDVVDTMKEFASWGKIQHGGGFVGVPTDTKTFLPHVMNRFGFLRTGIELYEIWAE